MSSIPFRSLGNSGISVSALGLGCMGMSFLYGPTDDAENMRVLHRYRDLGGNFLDTAEVYGPYTNEELLGRFLKEIPRESVVVATKFGFRLENGERTGKAKSCATRQPVFPCQSSHKTSCNRILERFLRTNDPRKG
jgi:aryl-alcohol dehydrogenase-like predicted oxidoreductase